MKNTVLAKNENNELGVPKTKWGILDEPTPPDKIKKRKGRGGQVLDYVDIGYVVKKLDEVFNKAWDFEIVDKQIGQDHIWVLGKLNVKFLDPKGAVHSIIKMQFGGSDLKRTKEGKVIDIGDDLKAAASDSLKKCASLLGVAKDIYFRENENGIGNEIVSEEKKESDQSSCQHEWKEFVSTKTGRKYRKCFKCGKYNFI